MSRAAPVLLAAALGCGVPVPEPLPRVVGASPEGGGVSTLARPEIRFTDPVSPDGLTDGARLVLAPAASLAGAVEAVESDAGAAAFAEGVPCSAALADGGRRVVLSPAAPLGPYTAHALVLSSRTRAADGRQVLDPEGRRSTFVARFETGPQEGPPPIPVLTEVRADAETPEAGGEYAEVANLGAGALDLRGWRLSKRTASGTLQSCAVAGDASPIPPGGVALLAGGAWDRRYDLPAGVPVLACGTTALAGGIANDRAPALLLSSPLGEVASTFGESGGPICAVASERLDPAGADAPANLACTGGSPGTLPSR